jgi:hypothetical protein
LEQTKGEERVNSGEHRDASRAPSGNRVVGVPS